MLWQALEAGAREVEMAGMLVERFGIDSDLATRDVSGFLDRLRARRLVEAEPG